MVKICDKMYYFLTKITCLRDSLYFSFIDFIAMPEGPALPGVPKQTIPCLISCNVKPMKAISLK